MITKDMEGTSVGVTWARSVHGPVEFPRVFPIRRANRIVFLGLPFTFNEKYIGDDRPAHIEPCPSSPGDPVFLPQPGGRGLADGCGGARI